MIVEEAVFDLRQLFRQVKATFAMELSCDSTTRSVPMEIKRTRFCAVPTCCGVQPLALVTGDSYYPMPSISHSKALATDDAGCGGRTVPVMEVADDVSSHTMLEGNENNIDNEINSSNDEVQ
jgi:hypothetical protein